MRNGLFATALLSCLVLNSLNGASAWAQSAPPAAPAAVQPDKEKIDEARRHYDRGLQLYTEENYEAALVEMERAYKIAPTYRIQYNLGRIHRQLNNYAAGIRAFEAYLGEGGANVPTERREEVEKDLALLRSRVARLEVAVNIVGADVFVDDVPVGRAPIHGTLVVNPGRRKVSATKVGYAPATQIVTVVGTDAEVVRLTLVDLRPAERHVDPAPRNRAIVAWGVTGLFTVSSVVFGVLALNASDKLKTDRDQFGVDPAVLSKDGTKVKTFAAVTDGLAIGAVLSAGVATYFTWRALKGDSPEARRIDVSLGPAYMGVHGSF